MPRRRPGRETLTDQERKILAEDLLTERRLNGRSPAESWQHVRPDSQAQPNSARTLFHRTVNWYADRFPRQCQQFLRRLRKKSEEKFQAQLREEVAASKERRDAALRELQGRRGMAR